MNKRTFAPVVTAVLSMTALLILLSLMAQAGPDAPRPAQAAPLLAVPTVTEVDPSSAPNDLDTPIVITRDPRRDKMRQGAGVGYSLPRCPTYSIPGPGYRQFDTATRGKEQAQ
jgi:hypothetical protein